MSGRWVALRRLAKDMPVVPGENAVWVQDGEQVFTVAYTVTVGALDAGEAIGKAQELWGGSWTAVPRPLHPATSGGVQDRVQTDLPEPESVQVRGHMDWA